MWWAPCFRCPSPPPLRRPDRVACWCGGARYRWVRHGVCYGVMASRAEAGQDGHVALRPFLSERYVAFTHTTVLWGTSYAVFSLESISTDEHLPPWKNILSAVTHKLAHFACFRPVRSSVGNLF